MKKIETRGEAPFKIRKISMKAESTAAAGSSSCSPVSGDGTDKPPC